MLSSSSTRDDENKMINIEEEEANEVLTSSCASDAAPSSTQNLPPTNIAAASTATPLHLIDDSEEGLPLPIGMAENISNATEPPKQIGKVELIDDDVGPALPMDMNMMFDDGSTEMAAAIATGIGLEEFDVEDDDALTKKIAKEDMMNQKPAAIMSHEDLIHVPTTRQDIQEGDIQSVNTNRGDGSDNRRGWGDIESRGGGIGSQSQQKKGMIRGETTHHMMILF